LDGFFGGECVQDLRQDRLGVGDADAAGAFQPVG
jgi:hypothetical protein